MSGTQTTVLREMLVRIGWIYDRVSQRDVEGVLTRMETGARRLAISVAAATTSLGIATVASARFLNQLSYVSDRTGSSVDSIRAFSFAISQMGGSSEEAQSSLENLARAIRDNPGMRSFVQGLVGPGVNTSNTVQTMQALATRFRNTPYAIARQQASFLGIDERTLQAMIQGTGQFEDRYRQMARRMGMDSTQSAQHAREFMRALNELQLVGQFAVEKLVIALAKIAPSMVEGAESFALWLERTIPKVDDFVQKIGGWEPILIVVGAALTLHLLSPLTRIAAVLAGLLALRLPAWVLAALGLPAALVGGAILLAPSGANEGEDDAVRRREEEWERNGRAPTVYTPEELSQAPQRPQQRTLFGVARDMWDRITNRLPEGDQQRLGNLAQRFFESAGWEPHQAAGIVGNIQHESGFRENAVGDGGMSFGLAQWNRSRLDDLGRFISAARGRPSDPRSATYFEQLQFIQHELTRGSEQAAGRSLAGARTAGEAGAIISREYERPRVDEGFARGRTSEDWFRRSQAGRAQGVIVNQNIDITVNGGTDPERTGAAVGRVVQRNNADLLRNMRGATR